MNKNIGMVFCLCFLLAIGSTSAHAQNGPDNTSHLPIPRFVSLRNSTVNMRAGPGFRYPIRWVYSCKGLPMEVTAEYDIWRRVRDPEGTEGWISKTELTGRRMAFITGDEAELRRDTDTQSRTVAYLKPRAVGRILSCEETWCKIQFENTKGFLPKTEFWGAYENETFN